MNALEFLISVLLSLGALLSVLAAYEVMRSASKILINSKTLPPLKGRYQADVAHDLISNPAAIKTIGIIRNSVSLLNEALDTSSQSIKWYLPLLDNEFKTALVGTVSKCLQMPENELSKQVIETLYASTSAFLRAAKLLDLNNDVQGTIAEYVDICSIAKKGIDLCNAYEAPDSAVNNVNTYTDDSNLANKQICDKSILVG